MYCPDNIEAINIIRDGGTGTTQTEYRIMAFRKGKNNHQHLFHL